MPPYAVPQDLTNIGIAAAALTNVTHQAKLAAIDAASELADSYLAAQFTLPLVAWNQDLTRAVVNISVYDLMSNRGFSPQPGSDENIRLRYEDAIKWLENVAANKIIPQVTDSASASTSSPGGEVISSSSRGWSNRGTGGDRPPFTGD